MFIYIKITFCQRVGISLDRDLRSQTFKKKYCYFMFFLIQSWVGLNGSVGHQLVITGREANKHRSVTFCNV